MIDVSEQKQRIYSILFENYRPGCKNRMSHTAESIIKASFNGDAGALSLQELNFAVITAIRNIVDYIEMSDENIDIGIAHKLATRFVIKATGFEQFWEQMADAGLVSLDDYNEWI